MLDRSRLLSLTVRNIGCIGPEGLSIELNNIVCLVGKNNSGKSSVLRAYELAQASKSLEHTDICHWMPEGDCSEVIIDVHIPDEVQNIAKRWKKEINGLKIVRSRWQWKNPGEKPERKTWNPEAEEWAEDGTAGGLDSVFNSRLPQPIRIDSLQDSAKEHDELLKIVTDPIAESLKIMQTDPSSNLRIAIDNVVQEALAPVKEYQEEVDKVAGQIGAGFKGVFPQLDISIKIGMDTPSIDVSKEILKGSAVKIHEGGNETALKQQGTGSRRALFWSLLQVRNLLIQERKIQSELEKQRKKVADSLGKEESKAKPDAEKIEKLRQQLKSIDSGEDADSPALPGYILLIDEPENALHPMAIRAARNHLYKLAQDPNWQVMLTTHSPYFIDPLEDHTTIVRLEREDKRTAPKTFRTDTLEFGDPETKENLRALLQMDTSLAEMFFGSYPIIVEGDTELAAFIAAINREGDQLETAVSLIPARGKMLIEPLIRLLTHFNISFGVLHDSDSPLRRDGKKNSAWKANENILIAVAEARASGLAVRHRICVPDFEREVLDEQEAGKDKPILAYAKIRENKSELLNVQRLFKVLFESDKHSFADDENEMECLVRMVQAWAENYAPDDGRFKFPTEEAMAKAKAV